MGVKITLKRSAVSYLRKISFLCYLQTQNLTLHGEVKKMLSGFPQVSSTNKFTENTKKQSFTVDYFEILKQRHLLASYDFPWNQIIYLDSLIPIGWGFLLNSHWLRSR